MLVRGQLTAGHARALIGLENAEELARKAVAKGLSVREIEKLATQARPASDAQAPGGEGKGCGYAGAGRRSERRDVDCR